MNLHDVPMRDHWVLEYENADGEAQRYDFLATRAEADTIQEFMDQVDHASGGMISDAYVTPIQRSQLSTATHILSELHDFYDDYLEDAR